MHNFTILNYPPIVGGGGGGGQMTKKYPKFI